MKASIKLITSQPITKLGYPIYVELRSGKRRKRKLLGRSHDYDWDIVNNRLLQSHPDYNDLAPLLLEVNAQIKRVNYGAMNFDAASDMLFGPLQQKNNLFVKSCRKYCDSSTNGILYNTVLNSFDKVNPWMQTEDITPEVAKRYMQQRLEKYSANGVHAYMRTLTALFGKISDKPNPFKGIRPKKVETIYKDLTAVDVKKIATTETTVYRKYDKVSTALEINKYRYYWLLLFYLGGIDMELLARARYDKHVVNGRLQIQRQKGGSNVYIDNIIVPQALEILQKFNCKPYLVDIYKYKNYKNFLSNFSKRFTNSTAPGYSNGLGDLQLTKKPYTKSARYTFINLAQDLLIDERITMAIVGHKERSTHSIYKRAFPTALKDKAHHKIVDLNDVVIPLDG